MSEPPPPAGSSKRTYDYRDVARRLGAHRSLMRHENAIPSSPMLPAPPPPVFQSIGQWRSRRRTECQTNRPHPGLRWLVPDFAPVDQDLLFPDPYVQELAWEPALRWAVYWAVLQQRRSTIVLPVELLSQVIAGNHPSPRAFIQVLKPGLEPLIGDWFCPAECPYHTNVFCFHPHYWQAIPPSFLGVLESFAASEEDGERRYAFPDLTGNCLQNFAQCLPAPERHRVVRAYLPLLVFGSAKAVKLKHFQRRLLQTLLLATTKAPDGAGARADEAGVILGNQVPTPDGKGHTTCPLLDEGGSYIGFNGNGQEGRTGWLWEGGETGFGLSLAGDFLRPAAQRMAPDWPSDRTIEAFRDFHLGYSFLTTLKVLVRRFGLIVACYHLPTREWYSLSQLCRRARSDGSCMQQCQLRVYVGDDYLTRWRQDFANRMGFEATPDGITRPGW